MDAAALSEILTRVAVCGAVLLALAAVAVAVWEVVREEWRRGGKVARRVFLVAAAGAATYGGAKNYRASVSYPPTEAGHAYLVDRGSYVTNDFVHIDFTRRIVPDDAALVVERREVASTNAADWATYLETTFAAFAVPTNLPCVAATNWNWAIWADWTPPPSVQTNGVLHAEWGRTTRDAALRAAGLAVGVPVRSSVVLDGGRMGVPSCRVYTARDYVQDGLIAMWDGIENAGWGVHDPDATVWKDLTGNGFDAAVHGAAFGESEIVFGDDPTASYAALSNTQSAGLRHERHSMEVVWRAKTSGRIIFLRSPFGCTLGLIDRGAFLYTTGEDYRSGTRFPFGGGEAKMSVSVGYEDVYRAVKFHANGKRMPLDFSNYWSGQTSYLRFGNRETFTGGFALSSVRLYSRALTDEEIAHNYKVDRARFGVGTAAGVSAASASSLSPETAARAASDALDALTGAAIAIDPIATPEERKTAK